MGWICAVAGRGVTTVLPADFRQKKEQVVKPAPGVGKLRLLFYWRLYCAVRFIRGGQLHMMRVGCDHVTDGDRKVCFHSG